MAESRPPAEWPRCARCGGQVHRDGDGALTCLWCGEVRYPASSPATAAAAYGVRLGPPRESRR
jgi:hypothetical protein